MCWNCDSRVDAAPATTGGAALCAALGGGAGVVGLAAEVAAICVFMSWAFCFLAAAAASLALAASIRSMSANAAGWSIRTAGTAGGFATFSCTTRGCAKAGLADTKSGAMGGGVGGATGDTGPMSSAHQEAGTTSDWLATNEIGPRGELW